MFTVIYHNVEVDFDVDKLSELFTDEDDRYSYTIVNHPYISGGLAVSGDINSLSDLIRDMKQSVDEQLKFFGEDPHLHLETENKTVFFFSHSECDDEDF